ncbi:helicase DnaB [Cyanobium sp. Morenito 9A2]|uniref:helicase DnaB n=1 Tax=Cyanobium sp. Morenito 9A2 TaxID=2823718 RepID=UPI0020CC493E|nr:helicase DnaB [Cyanobium sp. Morenito 9A2]
MVRRRFLLGFSVGLALAIGLDVAPRMNRWSSSVIVSEPGLTASVGIDSSSSQALINEGQRSDPTNFSPQELRELQRRFGVHGPQTPLAQLFTKGLDELTPLRAHTVSRLEELRPTILIESRRRGVNPMLVAAILFDEMQHAKPGENLPLAAHSGLFSTHGPAQLGLSEMVKQGLLGPEASEAEIQIARDQLLDPKRNVQLLVGQLARQKKLLGISTQRPLNASTRPRDAKAMATLAYLHNGKLDYPTRILRYMQDPELHALIYSARKTPVSGLI